MERLEAIVTGRVQGVGFRFFVEAEAFLLGLRGYVKNLPDGTLEVVAEGGRAELGKLLSALERGPPLSRVGKVGRNWAKATGEFSGFSVRH